MRQLYKYTGTVSSFSYRRNNPNALPFCDLILFDSAELRTGKPSRGQAENYAIFLREKQKKEHPGNV